MSNQLILRNQTDLSTERADLWTQAANDWLMNFNSERTRESYSRSWAAFIAFTDKRPGDVTQSDVIAFKAERVDKGMADSTINLNLSALSSFYRFAIERGLLETNPVAGVKRRPVKPYGKATWLDPDTDQDIALLQQPDTDTLIGKRDYAILLILLTTGIRVSAVAGARVGDVQRGAKSVRLTYVNKGGESETAELLPFVHEAIVDYLSARGFVEVGDKLFVTIRSNRTSFHVKPLSRHAITGMVSRYAEAAELHHVTAHSLRHTAAMVAQKYATMAEIKTLLRHKSIRTTGIYLDHVGDPDVSKVTRAIGKRYRRNTEED